MGIHCTTITFVRCLCRACTKASTTAKLSTAHPLASSSCTVCTLFSLLSFFCIVARAIGAPECFPFVCRTCIDAYRIGVSCFCSSSFACRPTASPSAPRFLRRPRTRYLLVLSSQTRGACRLLVHEPGQRTWTTGFFSYGESQPRSYLRFKSRWRGSLSAYKWQTNDPNGSLHRDRSPSGYGCQCTFCVANTILRPLA